MTKQVKIFVAIIGLLILGTVAAVLINSKPSTPAGPSKYQALAQCIKDSGATFYGAFWCPHCQAEEADFQMTRQQLADIGLYTECSTADASGQTQICIDKKITEYPHYSTRTTCSKNWLHVASIKYES